MIKFVSALVHEFALRQSDYIDYRVLAANTHEAHNVPAGTTCIRIQLWSAPVFLGGKTPALAPGVLQYPTRGINLELAPDRRVALNFPYASHPATGQTVNVTVGDVKLPVFPGFFQRWWYVRLRLEERWVKDIPGEREVCEPVPDANGDGHPDRGGDCRVILGDPPVEWPGEKKIERYVKAKEWENREVDGILNLTALGYLYDGLHPPSGLAYTPDGRVRIPLIMRNGQPWLWIPIAVREGQGVVCANPGCVGSEFELP
ncbi:MAG: hypothetical protein NZM16_13105 [Thermoflexus sp.]|uniref:hypothetical protein n=1 Tax=Thermoflexus sp. TaxID=1969742 RepID=UPI0025CEE4C4|nr:hypothetical protein [Thermoflexus sp.]MCS6964966.1 hypothetical protein [Thermoflexus sp.]